MQIQVFHDILIYLSQNTDKYVAPPHEHKKISGGNTMKLGNISILVLFFVCMGSFNVFADDDAKKQELMDAVDYSVSLIESKGKAAFGELEAFRFNDGKDYIYITNYDAVVIMHPVAPELLNKDCTGIRGAKGKYFGAEMKSKAQSTGVGWTNYWWPNPAKNGEPDLKCSYFKVANMGGEKVIVYAASFGISEKGCE